MAIETTVKEKIKNDLKLRQLIGIDMGVSERTVSNWVDSNNAKLETNPVITILKRELNLSKSEILVKEVITSDGNDEHDPITEKIP